ncbi:extracellular calcium-sensing receptor-like [Protopterus annectens]|uniref:extracellular calcium-sensing receptor-like n=1 Tax=Protopterus annectens TaxID=7888 RepID=UPI001CFC43B1|nr:extracellular calcium-sensing receptor-like [Protopterus annectens]
MRDAIRERTYSFWDIRMPLVVLVTLISYATEDLSLSDHNQFPSFLRTIPSNKNVLDGMVQLLLHFQWKWVGVLVPDDSFQQKFSLVIRKKLEDSGICIGLFQFLGVKLSNQVYLTYLTNMIKMSPSKVFIVLYSPGLVELLQNLVMENVTGITWIGLDWWPQSSLFVLEVKFHALLHGTLWFAMATKTLSGFKDFLYNIHPSKNANDIFAGMFWETVFGCLWPDLNGSHVLLMDETVFCNGEENLRNLNNNILRFFTDMPTLLMYSTYNAVWAVIHALQEMQACKNGAGPFINGSCAQFPNLHPWQFFHYVCKANFTTPANDNIFFDEDGFTPMAYNVFNFQNIKTGYVATSVVGIYDPRLPASKRMNIATKNIMWNNGYTQPPRSVCSESCLPGFRKSAQNGKPECCYDCVPCSEGEISNQSDSNICLVCLPEDWPNERRDKCVRRSTEFLAYSDILGAALTSVITICSVLTAVIFAVFVKFSGSVIVKANNRNISYLLLFALLICFLCSLIFIGYPDKHTCKFRQIVFGVAFVLSVSCVLAKTIMVVVAFNATKPNSNLQRWMVPQLPYAIVSLCTFAQFILCATWIICSPPFPEQNFKFQAGIIVFECNEGSVIAFWFMLGFMALLAGVCFIIAFLSRNLPDSFNEAKFIAFSMIVFVSVWLAFIPAYLSTKGKYTVAVEIFAILASSAGLLLCIYFPKCYIILLRPDMNTKEYIMGRGQRKM